MESNDTVNNNEITNSINNNLDKGETEDGVRLKREITLLGGVSVIVGSMIGSGIFISPVGVLENANSIGASLLIWLLCGLVATCGSLSYAELGTMIPKSGAEYPYLKEAFGSIPAFLFAWTSSIVLKPTAVAMLGLIFGEYSIKPFFPDCDEIPMISVKLAAATCICVVTFFNCFSVKIAERTQIIFTVAKILILLIIIITGMFALASGETSNMTNMFNNPIRWETMGTSLYQGFWAYDGWNQLNYITEELHNPIVNLPRAIMIGIPFVTFIYLLTNIAYLAGLSLVQMFASRAVAVTFGVKFLGAMAWIMPLGVAISTFGGCNGYTITSPRILYVAARGGHMPRVLAMVNYKRATPIPAILFNSFIALLALLPNDFDSLLVYFSFSMWVFHGGSALALLYLRYKQPNRKRPYKVPLPIPIIVVLVALYLIFYPIITQPSLAYVYSTFFILSGLIFYFPLVHYRFNIKCMDSFTDFLQKLLLVTPSNIKVT